MAELENSLLFSTSHYTNVRKKGFKPECIELKYQATGENLKCLERLTDTVVESYIPDKATLQVTYISEIK